MRRTPENPCCERGLCPSCCAADEDGPCRDCGELLAIEAQARCDEAAFDMHRDRGAA